MHIVVVQIGQHQCCSISGAGECAETIRKHNLLKQLRLAPQMQHQVSICCAIRVIYVLLCVLVNTVADLAFEFGFSAAKTEKPKTAARKTQEKKRSHVINSKAVCFNLI